MQAVNRQRIILASPIVVVILGHFSAEFFTVVLGRWAWAAVLVLYWVSLLFIIAVLGKKERFKAWLAKPRGSRGWLVLAVVTGLIAFPFLLLPNMRVLNSPPLVITWFGFAAINSFCEEVYWRGFLLDETSNFPRPFGIVYSTLLFTAIHPLMLGGFSRILSFDSARPLALLPFGAILVLLSLVYCLLYLQTNSLRWPILSHFLADLGNLSIFVFMNMISA